MDPLVSVIIPCFNAGKFLEEAVRSVMQQTYSNIEIIIVNDCSTDDSPAIIAQLQKEDVRIILFNNLENLGISKTLNKAIENSRGKYIARMDADDICFPGRIEKQVNFLEQNPDIAICGGNFIKIDEQGNKTGKVIFPTGNKILKAELLFYCPFAHPAMMLRKTVLETVGGYKDLAPAEDYELWLRIAEKFNVENLSDYLIYYRVHSSSISANRGGKLWVVLNEIVQEHIKASGFAENYLPYHLKFLEGAWYQKASVGELGNIGHWKDALLQIHHGNDVMPKVFDKYISLAMLSILKSKTNTLPVKLMAAAKLLTINPFITLKHFLR
jgi:glycosyltransferase involved in cell wall biosynthesis